LEQRNFNIFLALHYNMDSVIEYWQNTLAIMFTLIIIGFHVLLVCIWFAIYMKEVNANFTYTLCYPRSLFQNDPMFLGLMNWLWYFNL
jgi:hypothetical protein